MTSIPDHRSQFPIVPQVNYEEPATKPPPILEVGPLAWARRNLFSSTLDTVLTIGFALLAISGIVGVVSWAIRDANWFVVNLNLRQFMIGRFPVEEAWRVEWMVLYLFFVIGFSLGTWSRLSRVMAVIILVVLAVTFIVPPVVAATTAPPVAYISAGNAEIKSGSITEMPLPNVAFIGQQGEAITIQIASVNDDDDLAGLAGFIDRASNAVVNAAINRLAAQTEKAQIETRLETDLLTEVQRADLTDALSKLTIADPVYEALTVNRQPVDVQVLDGTTQKVLAEQTLTNREDALSLTLPASGWYLLHKVVSGDQGVTLLKVSGIAPMLVNQLSANENTYHRIADNFETTATRPQIDGNDTPLLLIIDNQFTGSRSFGAFMRMLAAPFLQALSVPLLLLAVAAAVGYGIARVLKGVHPPDSDKSLAERAIPILWLLTPIIIYVLISAVDPLRWGGLLLTFLLTAVGIVGSFPIGVLLALGRRSSLPIVKASCILFIELVRGVPLITILFMAQLMLPLLNPALVTFPNVLRAMVGITLFSAAYLAENVRGGLQSIPSGQEEAARALGLSGWQVTLLITLPQALRAVIPALVGQAISLFKDTSLVAIVGLSDLLKIADSSVAQSEFIGTRAETYLFIAIIYFGFSYIMAYISRRIEASGSGAARRI